MLCKSLGISTGSPEDDLQQLNYIIEKEIQEISDNTICEIFGMEFITMCSLDDISPLKYFHKLKIIDFHGEGESAIRDFSPLKSFSGLYVLDYSDYKIIDFDKSSDIDTCQNITYIKNYGFPSEIEELLKCLNGYNLNE